MGTEQAVGHTPGPWKVKIGERANPEVYTILEDQEGEWHIATIWAGLSENYQQYANARLIAAAPDLLEACQHVVNCMLGEDWERVEGDLLLNAIAKAKGTT